MVESVAWVIYSMFQNSRDKSNFLKCFKKSLASPKVYHDFFYGLKRTRRLLSKATKLLFWSYGSAKDLLKYIRMGLFCWLLWERSSVQFDLGSTILPDWTVQDVLQKSLCDTC